MIKKFENFINENASNGIFPKKLQEHIEFIIQSLKKSEDKDKNISAFFTSTKDEETNEIKRMLEKELGDDLFIINKDIDSTEDMEKTIEENKGKVFYFTHFKSKEMLKVICAAPLKHNCVINICTTNEPEGKLWGEIFKERFTWICNISELKDLWK